MIGNRPVQRVLVEESTQPKWINNKHDNNNAPSYKALDNMDIKINIFPEKKKNTLLVLIIRNTSVRQSKEYPQHMVLWRNKINKKVFLKKKILPEAMS